MAQRQNVTQGKNMNLQNNLSKGRGGWAIPAWVGIGLMVAAIVGGVIRAAGEWDGRSATVEQEPTVLGVRTGTLRWTEGATVPRHFSGIIRAARASDLGFKRAGRLERVWVQSGDKVEAGQVLASLDRLQVAADLKQAEASLAAAEAELAEAKAGPRVEAIEAARAQVADQAATARLWAARLERMRGLRSGQAISEQEYDDARYQWEAAAGRLSAAESRLAELEAGTRKEQIQLAVARVAQWQATVERLQVELTDSELVAPFSGTVARRDADEGVVLPAGASVLRLVEPASEAWIGLPPDFTAALGERTHHRVSVGGDDYVATVRDILPEVDLETRTQTVVLSVQPERPEQSLPLPGQMARLTLPSPVSASGFWVPTTALSRGGKGLWALHVVVSDPPVVERRDVEVLRVDSDRVLVRGVIQAGESFVTTGLHRLTSGQRVKIENNSVEKDVYSESASKFE